MSAIGGMTLLLDFFSTSRDLARINRKKTDRIVELEKGDYNVF